MENVGLKKSTKKLVLVLTILLGLMFVISFIVGTISDNFNQSVSTFNLILSSVSYLFIGILNIKTYKDYNKSDKLMLIDGIIDIVFVLINAIICFFIPLSLILVLFTLDFVIPYAFSVVFLVFGLFKFIRAIINTKRKHFDFYLDIIASLLIVLNGLTLILSMYLDNVDILFMIVNIILVITIISKLILTYLIKKPDYLLTTLVKVDMNNIEIK